MNLQKNVLDLPQILVVDLGSQYTALIVRSLRELGVRSAHLPPAKALKFLKLQKPKGIIWSGGAASVDEQNAPIPPTTYLGEIPVLGICYGMHYIALHFGGTITHTASKKEYGPRTAKFLKSPLFKKVKSSTVWCSHGDSVDKVPKNFSVIATSNACPIFALESEKLKVWAVQFHPEVTHTTFGKQILSNFVFDICHCARDWHVQDVIEKIGREIDQLVPYPKKALIGYSGGVDSSTLATIAKSVLGKRLEAVTIDGGNLRENERDEITTNAESCGITNLKIVKVQKKLLCALAGTTDPEEKRKRFKKIYKQAIEQTARRHRVEVLIQGSLAPDFIESGAVGMSSLIKSHHNIGLKTWLCQIHPLSLFFKYEVRELARQLGLPVQITERQPFPGPGLIVRVTGAQVTKSRLAVVRQADSIVRKILKESGEYNRISQLVIALYGVGNVAVKGDARRQGHIISIKGAITQDYMTAECIQLQNTTRQKITCALTSQIPDITRVVFDETPKPPATIEPE